MRIKFYAFRALLCGTSIPLAVIGPVHAQQATVSKNPVQMQEVVVTARKRTENVQKVPVAITVVTGNQLKAAGVTDVASLQNVVPSLIVDKNPLGVNISLRGIETADLSSKGSEDISFTIDGTPINRPQEEAAAFLDIARVEVLYGPQGTLYGADSTGGAINLITNKPTQTLGGSADVQIGNYNTKDGDAVLNVPINNILAVRAAASYNYNDGYINLQGTPQKLDSTNNFSGRFEALARFNDDLEALFTFTGGTIGGSGAGSANVTANSKNVYTSINPEGSYNPFPGQQNDRYENYNYQIDDAFGPVHVSYQGTYDNYVAREQLITDTDPAGDDNNYGLQAYHGEFNTYYQELRISNQDPGPLTYVAGANWTKDAISEDDHTWNIPVSNPVYSAASNASDPLNQTSHTDYSVFAQGTYALTSQFHLTLGAREAWDRFNRIGTFAAGPGPWPSATGGGDCVFPEACLGSPNNEGESSSKFTWRVGLDDQITPTQMVYASVATGYKPGGANDYTPTSNGKPVPYNPEELSAYEVGYKGRPTAELQINSSLYYYDYSEDQIVSAIPYGGFTLYNIYDVPTTLYGWQTDIHYLFLTDNVLDTSLALEKSKYNKFFAGLGQTVNWDGKSLDKTPAALFTIGLSHYFYGANGATWKLHADTKISSSYVLSDVPAAVQYTQPWYTRSDADLTYTWPNSQYSVEGYVHNIENKVQAENIQMVVDGVSNVDITEPRTWGARFSLKF